MDQQDYDLRQFDRIIVVGGGKAGAPMAKAIEEVLGDRISAGVVTVKYDHLEKLNIIKLQEAGHPIPDHNGYLGALEILQLASSADDKTLVICLISGGGSALMPMPVSGVTLGDKQTATQVLLDCGATIHEINTIRKHLSVIKGGGLARVVYPATLITLILSDVVGNDLDIIASGPSVPDPTTFAACKAIFTKYAIENEIPLNVIRYVDSGVVGDIPETPKMGRPFFKKVQNIIVADNSAALLTAKEKADELGYNSLLLSSMTEGDTCNVAASHIAIARQIQSASYPLQRPACLLSGGETTVRIKGEGKGGRNQEFVLAAALNMSDMKNITVLSAGTDGTDGPTDAAGAVADDTTVQRSLEAGMDPQQFLDNNDSYNFFDRLNDLYKTGPTNTNVMDLRIILIL